jgi:hypothetical protein
MQCPQCSATLSDSATVCSSCRYVLRPRPQTSTPVQQDFSLPQKHPPVNIPLQWPFGKFILGLCAAVVVFGGYIVGALLSGGKITDPAAVISLIFGLTALIALPIVFIYSLVALRTMRSIAAGHYLIHWTYTEVEWNQFTQDAWQKSGQLNAVAIGVLALVLFGAAVLSGSAQIMLIGVVVLVMVALLMFGRDYWLYAQRQKQGAGEVLIGRRGILRPEGFIPLSHLESVKIEQGIITFRCRYTTTYGRRSVTYEVPVPRGHEDEAEHLVRAF